MFGRILPRSFDNAYSGHRMALGLFGVLLLMKSAMSFNCVFNGYSVATGADGIPLETFPAACVRMIVSDFALWGLSQFMLCLLGVVALVRYRGMVPVLFLLILLEHSSRKLILRFHPIEKAAAAPGSWVNLALFALEIAGLALSLWPRRDSGIPGPVPAGVE